MKVLDNVSSLLGDDLKTTLHAGSKLKIAAATFSIYAFEALRQELEKIDGLEFIFTAPAFLPENATDKLKKEHREFQIPKAERERSFYGSEFEIQLKNKLTQRAIAKECADWMVSDVHVPFAKIWRDGLQRVGATDCKSVDQRVANR